MDILNLLKFHPQCNATGKKIDVLNTNRICIYLIESTSLLLYVFQSCCHMGCVDIFPCSFMVPKTQ